MIGVVGQAFGESEGIGQAELPVERKHPASLDGTHDGNSLADVLLQEDGDLRVVHELLLKSRPNLVLQLGRGAAGCLNFPDERQRDDPTAGDPQPDLRQLLHLEDGHLEQVSGPHREIGVLRP